MKEQFLLDWLTDNQDLMCSKHIKMSKTDKPKAYVFLDNNFVMFYKSLEVTVEQSFLDFMKNHENLKMLKIFLFTFKKGKKEISLNFIGLGQEVISNADILSALREEGVI